MSSYTVGDYLLDRLKELGIRHLFGVPGDYVLGFNAQIEARSDVAWVANCNELNAAYAAEGYARANGVGALVVTAGVGDLGAAGGVGGALAEHSSVVVISGVPGVSGRGHPPHGGRWRLQPLPTNLRRDHPGEHPAHGEQRRGRDRPGTAHLCGGAWPGLHRPARRRGARGHLCAGRAVGRLTAPHPRPRAADGGDHRSLGCRPSSCRPGGRRTSPGPAGGHLRGCRRRRAYLVGGNQRRGRRRRRPSWPRLPRRLSGRHRAAIGPRG